MLKDWRPAALVAATLTGCGGPAAAPATATTPTPPPSATASTPDNTAAAPVAPPPPACVAAAATLGTSALRAGAFDACWDDPGTDASSGAPVMTSCWTFDLASSKWAFASRHERSEPKPTGPDEPQTEAKSATELQVCSKGQPCKTIKLRAPGVPDPWTDSIGAAASADGTLVAVISGHDLGKQLVRVLDATGKKLRDVAPWHTDMSGPGKPAQLNAVAFLDDALAIYVAATPVSSQIKLFAPRTGKLIGVVPGDNGYPEGMGLALGNHRFAFEEMGGTGVHIVDVATGKVEREFKLPHDDDSGAVLAVFDQLPDHDLLALDNKTVMRLAVATGEIAAVKAPTCPP